MKQIIILIISLILAFIYFFALNQVAPLVVVPVIFLLAMHSVYGWRLIIWPLVITGLVLDYHMAYFGIYTVSLLVALGVTEVLFRYVISQNTLLSNVVLYFFSSAAFFFIAIVFKIGTGTLRPEIISAASLGALLLMSILFSILVATTRTIYDIFNPSLLTNE